MSASDVVILALGPETNAAKGCCQFTESPFMHPVARFILVLIVSVSLSGCDRGRSIAERRAKEEAEKAQQGMLFWQKVAFGLGIGVVVVFVFGTALGSSARKHAKK